jgi:hypothetical protein
MTTRRSPEAWLLALLAAIAPVALLGCGGYGDPLEATAIPAGAAMHGSPSGSVAMEGSFELDLTAHAFDTQAWLNGATVTADATLDDPSALGDPVITTAASFPIALPAGTSQSVQVGFTLRSMEPPADELAWMCTHAWTGLSLSAVVYDTAADDLVLAGDTPRPFSVTRTTPEQSHFDVPWTGAYGDGQSAVAVLAAALDTSSNAVLTGTFTGSVDFGGGRLFNHAGESSAFVLKLDPAGSPLWTFHFSSLGEITPMSIAVDASGTTFVLGRYSGTPDLGNGASLPLTPEPAPLFLLALDPQGKLLWRRSFVMQNASLCTAPSAFVAADGQGGVFLAGTFRGSFDLGGDVLVYTPGAWLSGCDQNDAFVARLGPDGAHLWSFAVSRASPTGVAVDPAGNLLITGFFDELIDLGTIAAAGPAHGKQTVSLFAAKIDPAGTPIFVRSLGETRTKLDVFGAQLPLTAGPRIASDSKGNAVIATSFDGTLDTGFGFITSSGDFDLFLTKLDLTGSPILAQRFKDDGPSLVLDVGVASGDRIFIAGTAGGAVDFGGVPVQGNPLLRALYLAELDEKAGHIKSRGFACNTTLGTLAVRGDAAVLTAGVQGVIDLGDGVMHVSNEPALAIRIAP